MPMAVSSFRMGIIQYKIHKKAECDGVTERENSGTDVDEILKKKE